MTDPEPPLNKVPVDLDTGLVLHCPSCGAPVDKKKDHCEYCNSVLDFSLKGKTVHCPFCYATIAADSRFCMRCARPITGAGPEGELIASRLCPRCSIPMRTNKVGDFLAFRCDDCMGLFVPAETFEMMQDDFQRVVFSPENHPREVPDSGSEMRYVRCPVCKTFMNRSNFAKISGVIIDSCRGHGTWFDAGELEKIMDFIAHGGLQKAKTTELADLKAREQLARLQLNSRQSDAFASPWLAEPVGGTGGVHVLEWILKLLV